jgi:hypothetical protein
MRTYLALLCAVSLLALLFFLAYLEAERLSGWPGSVYRWFDPWFPFVVALVASAVTIVLPWFFDLFAESNRKT